MSKIEILLFDQLPMPIYSLIPQFLYFSQLNPLTIYNNKTICLFLFLSFFYKLPITETHYIYIYIYICINVGVFYHYPKTMQDNIFVLEMNKFKRLT